MHMTIAKKGLRKIRIPSLNFELVMQGLLVWNSRHPITIPLMILRHSKIFFMIELLEIFLYPTLWAKNSKIMSRPTLLLLLA
jgi:hypothetical protein